jgi:hypothetical protein
MLGVFGELLSFERSTLSRPLMVSCHAMHTGYLLLQQMEQTRRSRLSMAL